MEEALSPNRALRAATIKIRFAETIVKAKHGKLFDKSSSKSDLKMLRIQKDTQRFERKMRKEKARIEAAIQAPKLSRRKKIKRKLERTEKEAVRSKVEENWEAEKELVNLCGGSKLARIRWVEVFGLFMRIDDDCLEEEEAC